MNSSNGETERDQDEVVKQLSDEEVEKLWESLPKATALNGKISLGRYKGFWYHSLLALKKMLAFQVRFRAKDSDIIIASHPKTGTTWLESIIYAVVNRGNHPFEMSPLLNHNPHELVLDLQHDESFNDQSKKIIVDEIPSPRLLSTHVPYSSFPHSIMASKCRILYISRNPFDTIVSQWHFYTKSMKNKATIMVQEGRDDRRRSGDSESQSPPSSVEDYFEDFCDGRVPYGPFFDHSNVFWKWSLEESNKVLFLKYEDLKVNPVHWLKKIAEFVGVLFSPQVEDSGVIQQIIELCSISNLKGLEVNKQGRLGNLIFDKKDLFRKGEIGDWTHYFTPQMVKRMNKLMDTNFGTTGLSFDLLL